MAIQVNKMYNANIYVDGNELLARAESVELPKMKWKQVEHKGLGMFAMTEFPAGLEKMTAKIKWNSFYQDVLLKNADPFTNVQLQVRSSLETYDSTGRASQVPVVCFLTARYQDLDLGNFQQHENVDSETNLTVTSVKLIVNGAPIVEADALANIYKVNGNDLLSTWRKNLGA